MYKVVGIIRIVTGGQWHWGVRWNPEYGKMESGWTGDGDGDAGRGAAVARLWRITLGSIIKSFGSKTDGLGLVLMNQMLYGGS